MSMTVAVAASGLTRTNGSQPVCCNPGVVPCPSSKLCWPLSGLCRASLKGRPRAGSGRSRLLSARLCVLPVFRISATSPCPDVSQFPSRVSYPTRWSRTGRAGPAGPPHARTHARTSAAVVPRGRLRLPVMTS